MHSRVIQKTEMGAVMRFSKMSVGAAAAALIMSAGFAHAATIEVFPGDTSWKEGDKAGGGKALISGDAPRSGDGSIELHGDKVRWTYTASLGSLTEVVGLGFDWQVAPSSVSKLSADYSPALRLLIRSGFTSKELIWEGAYNGVSNIDYGTWYTVDPSTAKFYMGTGNENQGKTLAEWAADASMKNYTVRGISVGVGSSVGSNYEAYADNVRFITKTGDTTWNFNLTESAGAVPEPATWAMMIVGFGAAGSMIRSSRRRNALTAA